MFITAGNNCLFAIKIAKHTMLAVIHFDLAVFPWLLIEDDKVDTQLGIQSS